MTEYIRCSLGNKRYECGRFIYLQKAFDAVNHNVLLFTLDHYGIRENVLKSFESYLKSRKSVTIEKKLLTH